MRAKFKNIEQFNHFVQKLSDKSIQNWKTADWNKMFARLETVVENDSRLRAEVLERFGEDAGLLVQKRYFCQTVGCMAMAKLYRNYRLESQDFLNIRNIGKKIGKDLVEQGIDLAKNNINNRVMNGSRYSTGTKADKAAYNATFYNGCKVNPITQADYSVVKSEICIVSKEKMGDRYGSLHCKSLYNSMIELSDDFETDNSLQTAVHETIHAHFQVLGEFQEYEKENGILPDMNMTDGFYDLLHYNRDFYLRPIYDKSSIDKIMPNEDFVGCERQPLEKMADIIGVVAEHTFRQRSGQYSERIAQDLSLLVDDVVADDVFYDRANNSVTLVYKKEDLGLKNVFDFQKKYFWMVEQKTLEHLRVREDEEVIKVSAPIDYDIRLGVQKALSCKDEGRTLSWSQACDLCRD